MSAKKTTKTTKTSKTNKAKKVEKTEQAVETMTYGQVRALCAAMFHAGHTKAKMSEIIDKAQKKFEVKPSKPMAEDKKAQWLKEHGEEPATWGQCMMYAMTLFQAKVSKGAVSEIIAELDKASGYVREDKKAEQAPESEAEEEQEEGAK